MILYSQLDPAYSSLKLGSTTIGKDGCLVSCLASVFQVDPTVILKIPKAINSRGEADIKRVVEFLGGKLVYRGKIDPKTLCIAKTYHYKKQGVPTHFFIHTDGMMIDPLLHPTGRMPNIYKVEEFIHISGIKLDFRISDLQARLATAEKAIESGRLSGARASSVVRFIERGKKILSTFFS